MLRYFFPVSWRNFLLQIFLFYSCGMCFINDWESLMLAVLYLGLAEVLVQCVLGIILCILYNSKVLR